MSEIILQDQEIIDLTTQVNEGDYTKFKITLPGSDRVVTSENMKRSDIRASVLIDWCNAIRGQMHADYEGMREEMEAKRQKRIQEEDKAREAAAAEAGVVFADKAVHGVEGVLKAAQETSEEPKLIIPSQIAPDGSSQDNWAGNSDRLWADYGTALARVKRLEHILKERGEM